MTIVATNNITVSNVNDGTITHTAYAYSADGTDRFTTTYPNLNLLDGTRDFSGTWNFTGGWTTDGTYKGLTVKKKTIQWNGIHKTFTAPKDGTFTFSDYVKGAGTGTTIIRLVFINGVEDSKSRRTWTSAFDWTRDSITLNLKANDIVLVRNEISVLGTNQALWTAGHKWEQGSVATPWMPSSSEVKTSDYPSYIGTYSDTNVNGSTDPSKYTWAVFKGADGQNGSDGRGVSSTSQKWLVQSSSTKPNYAWSDSRWQTTLPAMSATNKYLYTIERTTYTDATTSDVITLSAIYGDTGQRGTDGADGTSGIIVSSVAPDSPQTGQLWQDTSTTPQIVKKWTGASWVIWELYAQNLKADNISVISLNLGDMTGGTVKLMDDVAVNDTFKKHGIYQSKLGLLSSGPSLSTPSTFSNSQMGVANLNRGELRFIVTDYTEDLKTVQESGISDQNTAFIRFSSYDNGKDVMVISSSGDIVFNGITSQDTPWIAMGNGAYYKNMFSRVYISYSVTATSTADIPLGVLPVGLRPFRGLHLTANAWAATLVNDRHIEVRTTGEVTLYNPANGASYDGEVSFTI